VEQELDSPTHFKKFPLSSAAADESSIYKKTFLPEAISLFEGIVSGFLFLKSGSRCGRVYLAKKTCQLRGLAL
jgi:hypothetical protein